jgi:hypothetical protein
MYCLLVGATVVTNTLPCAAMGKGVAMMRFTTEGTNDQEGRELIPAHRNAEVEEAPLGLSFEGGLAGPRRYSRRQAIGLLGGSLAGASLLSLGLAAPAESAGTDFNLPFRSGDHITLEWEGTIVPFSLSTPQRYFLDGRTQNGSVGLAPNTDPPFTGTRWEVARWTGPEYPPNLVFFKCLGDAPGPRRLAGYPKRSPNGTVGLNEHGSTWTASKLPQ